MRPTFVDEVTKLASEDKNVWLVTADLGFAVFEDFRDKFPDQFLNVGVAEQNLISVAAGLAMAGKKVFTYSISTFVAMRPYEQIRNDICYQNLPVCIVGGGSAFSYSTFGCTHFALEDVALMRILPNMVVAVPGDPAEVRAIVRGVYARNGPSYIRIAKRGEPVVNSVNAEIVLGRSIEIRTGNDVAILVCGRQLPNAIEAASMLGKLKIGCRVLSFHTVKPLDKSAILKAARETRGLVTVEEHFLAGGFGSAVAEILADSNMSIPFVRMGVTDEFPMGVGSQNYFLGRYGLTPEGIVETVSALLNKK